MCVCGAIYVWTVGRIWSIKPPQLMLLLGKISWYLTTTLASNRIKVKNFCYEIKRNCGSYILLKLHHRSCSKYALPFPDFLHIFKLSITTSGEGLNFQILTCNYKRVPIPPFSFCKHRLYYLYSSPTLWLPRTQTRGPLVFTNSHFLFEEGSLSLGSSVTRDSQLSGMNFLVIY